MSKVNEAKNVEQMHFEIIISKESFKNEQEKVINYYSYSLLIGDETFKLQPRPDDKRLLNHILNNLFDNEEDSL